MQKTMSCLELKQHMDYGTDRTKYRQLFQFRGLGFVLLF